MLSWDKGQAHWPHRGFVEVIFEIEATKDVEGRNLHAIDCAHTVIDQRAGSACRSGNFNNHQFLVVGIVDGEAQLVVVDELCEAYIYLNTQGRQLLHPRNMFTDRLYSCYNGRLHGCYDGRLHGCLNQFPIESKLKSRHWSQTG